MCQRDWTLCTLGQPTQQRPPGPVGRNSDAGVCCPIAGKEPRRFETGSLCMLAHVATSWLLEPLNIVDTGVSSPVCERRSRARPATRRPRWPQTVSERAPAILRGSFGTYRGAAKDPRLVSASTGGAALRSRTGAFFALPKGRASIAGRADSVHYSSFCPQLGSAVGDDSRVIYPSTGARCMLRLSVRVRHDERASFD